LLTCYLAHYRASGRSDKPISHFEDTFKVFTRFLAVSNIAPESPVTQYDKLPPICNPAADNAVATGAAEPDPAP
jgi:hypothetical protein